MSVMMERPPTKSERILDLLRERQGEVVSYEELGERFWGWRESMMFSRTITTHISLARRQLRPGERIVCTAVAHHFDLSAGYILEQG